MGKFSLKFGKKRKKEQKEKAEPRAVVKKEEKKKPVEKKLVKKGFARKGDHIATIKPAVPGKDGKNILGEAIPADPVYNPHLIGGKNVRIEGGVNVYMNIDGIVEVLEDEKGTFYISGKPYQCGRFIVTVSDDEMEVYLTVIPSIGGAEPVHPGDVLSFCKNQGIVFGVREPVIEETIEEAAKERKSVDNVLLAEGEEPVDGGDGRMEYRVRIASGEKVKVLEGGRVDYKEQDLISSVEEGQLIMVIFKAQEGVKDGSTVKGELLKAINGRDIEITVGNNIRVEDKGDSIHYYSLIGGQLFTGDNKLSVEPLMIINGNVGPETGNINFNGAVVIKGNVSDNYRVYAKKDVTITGNVGSAVIRSDENIIVQNGVIAKNKGLIYARGDVKVKFAENSNLQAGGSIYIYRAALNCKLTSGEKIISKKEKGQLIGGEIRATRGIEVKILGNESEHKTDVFVGSDFFLEGQLKELKQKIRKYQVGLQKLMLLSDKINQIGVNPDDLSDKLRKVYMDALKKKTLFKLTINDLIKKESEFNVKLEEIVDAEIKVYESLYRGVRIYFGKSIYEPDKTRSNVKVYFDRTYKNIRISRV